jgi:hypothetical protein
MGGVMNPAEFKDMNDAFEAWALAQTADMFYRPDLAYAAGWKDRARWKREDGQPKSEVREG